MDRILLFSGEGIAAPYIIESLSIALKKKGKRVRIHHLTNDIQRRDQAVSTFRPHLLITLDHAGIEDHYFESAKVLSWFVDFPFFIKPEGFTQHEHLHLAFSDKDFIPLFSNWKNCSYLPLALDRSIFKNDSDENSEFLYDLSFVGSFPGIYNDLRAKRESKGNEAINNITDSIYSLLRKGVLSYREIEEELEIETNELFKKLPLLNRVSIYWHAEQEFDAWKKCKLAEIISANSRNFVFGHSEWRKITPQNYHGKPDYKKDLAAIYKKSKINIILHRAQISSGLNQRVYDIAGVKGFFLCEKRADLYDFFPEHAEDVSFSSIAELKEKSAYYVNNPSEREAIAEYFHRKVTEYHTYSNIAGEIVRLLE